MWSAILHMWLSLLPALKPMNWVACLQAVRELQPDAVLEIGPGRAMARMWNANYPDVPARSIDDFRSPSGIQTWVDNVRARC